MAGLLLANETTAPFAGALLNTTVPVAVLPLATLAGLKLTDVTVIPDEFDGVTVMNVLFCVLTPWPSVTLAVAVTKVGTETTGGLNTAVAPLPLTAPLSAVHA